MATMEWNPYDNSTANAWTGSSVTYTLKGYDYDSLYAGVRPAQPGEIESALQWLDRRVNEMCVAL